MQELIKQSVLKKGTKLYHGTRHQQGGEEWWKTDFPNKIGEDGGISFTLDPESTPKVRLANKILEYEITMDVNILDCHNKGMFSGILKKDQSAICYTLKEREVVLTIPRMQACLKFVVAWNGIEQWKANQKAIAEWAAVGDDW